MAGPWNDGVAPQLTWAQLKTLNPASYNPSQLFYVSDIGIGGSYWYSNGARWRAVNGACWLYNPTTPVAHSGAATTEKLGEFTIPAGLLQVGDILETHVSVDATAGGSSGVMSLKLGLTGVSGDQTIHSASQPAGANLEAGFNKRHTVLSTTSMRLNDSSGASGLGNSGTGLMQTYTVPDLSANATKLTVWFQEGTGGVRVATLRNFAVELLTVGN